MSDVPPPAERSGGQSYIPDFTGGTDKDEPKILGSSDQKHDLGRGYLGRGLYTEDDVRKSSIATTNQLLQLQKSLVAAGFLEGNFIKGWWDDATGDAYRALLTFANENGLTWTDALTVAAEFGMGGPGGAGEAPLLIQLPNREDVQRTFDDAAFTMTDKRVHGPLIEKWTDEYMDYMRNIQESQLQEQRDATGGGTIVQEQPESLEGFIESKVEEEKPGDVLGAKVRKNMNTFFEALGSPI